MIVMPLRIYGTDCSVSLMLGSWCDAISLPTGRGNTCFRRRNRRWISCSPPSAEAYPCNAGDSPRGGCVHAAGNARPLIKCKYGALRCGKPKRQQFIETGITAHSIVDNSLPQAIFDFVCIATNMFLAIHDPCCSGDVLLTQGQMALGAE